MESHKKKDLPVLNAIKDRFETYYIGRDDIMSELGEKLKNNKISCLEFSNLLSDYDTQLEIDLFDSISELIYKDFIDREDRFKRTETE